MTLEYDFDVYTVSGKERFGASDNSRKKPDLGVSFQTHGTKVALFRDPATAAALRDAPTSIRTLFLEAGFGLNSHFNGVPNGFFPEDDKAVRGHILNRLQRRLDKNIPLDHNKGDFHLVAFLDAVTEAQPISDEAMSKYRRAMYKKATAMMDFDRTMFLTKVMGVVILAFITSRFTIQF